MNDQTPAADAIRVLIVDDEPPARERLGRMLADVPAVVVVGEAGNGADAIAAAARLAPDVVLLDIRMPGMDGIEAARHLGTLDDPPAVVFVTAHDEHALAAFEAQALGYLLKPVRQEKLVRCIQRAARVTGARLLRVAEQSQLGRRRQQVCARLGDQLRLIPVEDIYYFSAGQKYVTVRHRGGSDLIDESLRALADEFAPDFVRIHRNSLVAARYVGVVERGAEGQYLVRVTECGDLLPVSRRHAVAALRHIRGGH
jgi:two-component system response regulator AlgR